MACFWPQEFFGNASTYKYCLHFNLLINHRHVFYVGKSFHPSHYLFPCAFSIFNFSNFYTLIYFNKKKILIFSQCEYTFSFRNVRVVITVSSCLWFIFLTCYSTAWVHGGGADSSVIMHRLFLLCPAFKSYHVAANSPTEIAHLFLSTST